MKLTVIDNVIGKNYQNLIEDNFSTSKIAWYFAENITNQASDMSSSGFSHTIFKDNIIVDSNSANIRISSYKDSFWYFIYGEQYNGFAILNTIYIDYNCQRTERTYLW